MKKVEKISAGNVLGIGGLDDILFNMGTLSNDILCPSFAAADLKGSGIVNVAVEPENISEMNILIEGLKKVDKSDPSATYYQNDKGEYIISTCGQLHLERLQYDLIHHYAPIKLKFSEPIVSFKEAITYDKLNKALKPEQKYWF